MNDQNSALADLPRKLFNRNFILLLQARFVSQVGQEASRLAVMYLVMEVTGSATQMGVVAMLSALPALLAAPVGGFMADRYSRKWIMIGNDLFRGLILAALPVLLWLGASTPIVMAYIYLLSFVAAASGALFTPAVGALTPDLVPKARLDQANSLTQGSAALTSLLGQGLGGVLYRLLGPATLFLADAVSYIASAILLMFVREPRVTRQAQAQQRLADAFFADTREGFAYCWHQPGLRKILLSALVINFFAAPTMVLLPLLVDRTYLLTADWYGYFVATTVIGTIAGMMITGTVDFAGPRRFIASILGFALSGVGFLGVGFAPPLPLAIAMFFLIGFGSAIMNVLLISRLQANVESHVLGRVMAAVNMLASATIPLAMLIAGIVTDALGQNVLPVFIASGVAALGFVAWLASDSDIRAYMSGSDD